jgi:hypothetical protein
MPREPKRAKHNDKKYNLVVLVEGWLKNAIQDAAATDQVSIQQWCNTILLDAIRTHKGTPPLKEGTRLPTAAEELHNYLTGQTSLKPCGRTDCTPIPINLDKQTYCDTCGCRMQ